MRSAEQMRASSFVVCVNNGDHEVDLEPRKIYEVVPDESLEPEDIRVIDESGEDYIYPAEYFSPIEQYQMMAGQPVPRADVPRSDIEREARGFMEENEPLLSAGSALSLGRVFVQGANIATALSNEAVEAANRATSATNALAEAVRNPSTPARRLHELEAEYEGALELHERRSEAFKEFDEFLRRISAARRQEAGGD